MDAIKKSAIEYYSKFAVAGNSDAQYNWGFVVNIRWEQIKIKRRYLNGI